MSIYLVLACGSLFEKGGTWAELFLCKRPYAFKPPRESFGGERGVGERSELSSEGRLKRQGRSPIY